jgi:hypothetical protein
MTTSHTSVFKTIPIQPEKDMKNKVIISTFLIIIVGVISILALHLTEEYRVEKYIERINFNNMSNKDADIIEKVTMDGESFYILVVDEYIDNIFNSKRYYIVKEKFNVLGLTLFEKIYSIYDSMPGSSFINTDEGETYIFGLKNNTQNNTIIVALESSEEIVLSVTNGPVLFYYTKNFLQIKDIIPDIN